MDPLPETAELLSKLSMTSAVGLAAVMQEKAELVASLVPDCLGLSVSLRDEDLTFTWISTDDDVVRVLDATQYLSGGPCEVAAAEGEELDVPDLLSEERWQLLALASAAAGVRSSLSLPLRHGGEVVGSVNFYGTDEHTFKGAVRELAAAFWADVEDAVANADLSMSSVERARKSAATLETIDKMSIASGIIAARENISSGEALERIRDAAVRAGTDDAVVAELIIANRGRLV